MSRKVTFFFTKEYPASFLSYKDYLRHIVYALRRAGVTFVFSQGYHPRPIIYSVSSLSLGVESYIEPVSADIENDHVDEHLLSSVLPYGISYLGMIDGYVESYIGVYRYKLSYFILRHPEQGLGKFIKERGMQPYNILKEDIIMERFGSMLSYLGVK